MIIGTTTPILTALPACVNSVYIYDYRNHNAHSDSAPCVLLSLQCMNELVNEAPFMSTSELETVVSLCFRALDGSNYDVRCAVAELLGNLLATAQNPKALTGWSPAQNPKALTS